MTNLFNRTLTPCVDFSTYPDAVRIQQALKHYYNAHAGDYAQPMATTADFGLCVTTDSAQNVLVLNVVHLPSQRGANVVTTEDLRNLNLVEWMGTQVDRWLADYTPDMVAAFETHAEKASTKDRVWYRINAVTAENKLVMQRRLFETDYWQTVFTMQTHINTVGQSCYPVMGVEEVPATQLSLRAQFFCEDHGDVLSHAPLVQLVSQLFLDEGFSFFEARVDDVDDHTCLTFVGRQSMNGLDFGQTYYSVELTLYVEKFGPHEVLSVLNRIRDVVGDRLETKDSSLIHEEHRYGSVHNRSGLNE